MKAEVQRAVDSAGRAGSGERPAPQRPEEPEGSGPAPVELPDPSDSGPSYWLARTVWALGEGYAAFRDADAGARP